MHVIGYCDVGAGDFLKTTCGGDYVSRPESGFLQTLFFSKQTFARNTATKNIKTQSIFVL